MNVSALPVLPETIKCIVVLLPSWSVVNVNSENSSHEMCEEMHELDANAALAATCLSISPFTSNVEEITFGTAPFRRQKNKSQANINNSTINNNNRSCSVDSRVQRLQCAVDIYSNALLQEQNWDESKVDEIDLPFQYYYGPLKPNSRMLTEKLRHIHIAPSTTAAMSIRSLASFDLNHTVFVLVMNSQLSSSSVSTQMSMACLNEFVEECTTHHLHAKRGVLVVLADDIIREQLSSQLDKLNNILAGWICEVLYVRMWGPPALYFALTQATIQHKRLIREHLHTIHSEIEKSKRVKDKETQAIHQSSLNRIYDGANNTANHLQVTNNIFKHNIGWLESICAGVLLGTLKQLNVDRHARVPLIPLDVALNIGLLALSDKLAHTNNGNNNFMTEATTKSNEQQQQEEQEQPSERYKPERSPSSFSSASSSSSLSLSLSSSSTRLPPPPSFAVAEPACMSLVYIMLGEYINHYYVEETKSIQKVMCVPNIIQSSPKLRFPLSMQDVWRCGPNVVPATPLIHYFASSRRRSSLLSCGVPRNNINNNNSSDSNSSKSTMEQTQKLNQCNKLLQAVLRTLVDHADDAVELAYNIAKRDKELQIHNNELFSTTANNNNNNDNNALVITNKFDNSYYIYLLNKLTSSVGVVGDVLQFVALHEVDWGMYVQLIAKTITEEIAHELLHLVQLIKGNNTCNINVFNENRQLQSNQKSSVTKINALEQLIETISTHTINLSTPSRLFYKDFAFCADRCSAPALPLQEKKLNALYNNNDNNNGKLERMNLWNWIYNFGMRFNGIRGVMTAGLTPERAQAIIHQPQMQRVIYAVAAQEGVGVDTISERAMQLLVRIGDTQDHFHIKSLGLLVRPVFFKMFHKIEVNRGSYERLARLFERSRTAIVFVPLHRSYTDFIILSYSLALMTLPTPHIAAGEDFLHIGGLAEFMRASGAFFIRRSFRGDVLYTTLVREYVRQLLHHRQSVEFFIEGMRSRSGKTLNPKLGILKFILDAFAEEQTVLDDIVFIPVSISYDELPELTLYANELLGTPKPRESLRNFLKLLRLINHVYGSINVHFGENISLRAFHAMYEESKSNWSATTAITGIERPIIKTTTSSSSSSLSSILYAASPEPPLSLTPYTTLVEPVKRNFEDNNESNSNNNNNYSYTNSSGSGSYNTNSTSDISSYNISNNSNGSVYKELLVPLAYHITEKLMWNTVLTSQSLVAAIITYYLSLQQESSSSNIACTENKLYNDNNNNNNERCHDVGRIERGKLQDASSLGEKYLELSTLTHDVEWLREMLLARNGNVTRELRSKSVQDIVAEGVTHLSSCLRVHNQSNNTNVSAKAAAAAADNNNNNNSANTKVQLSLNLPVLASHVGLIIIANQLIHVFLDDAVVAIIMTAHGVQSTTHNNNINNNNNNKCESNIIKEDETWQLPWSEWYKSFRLIQPLLGSEFPQLSHRANLHIADEEAIKTRFMTAIHYLQGNHIIQKNSNIIIDNNSATVKSNGYYRGKEKSYNYNSSSHSSSENDDSDNSHVNANVEQRANKQEKQKSSTHTVLLSPLQEVKAETSKIIVPHTREFDFARSFLTPHMEALFMVLVGAKVFTERLLHEDNALLSSQEVATSNALANTHSHVLEVDHAVGAIRRAALVLYNEHSTPHALVGCKETLQHYFDALCTMDLFTITHHHKVNSDSKQTRIAYYELAKKQNDVLQKINELLLEVYLLRGKNVREVNEEQVQQEVQKISLLVMQEYKALCNVSKLEPCKQNKVSLLRRILRWFMEREHILNK